MPAGKLEDLILSALQRAQPHRLSMRSILKQIGVSTVERKKVDNILSQLMEQKLVAIADSLALIPEYYSPACEAQASLDEFPGFGTSLYDEKTKASSRGEWGEFLNIEMGSTESFGATPRNNWSDTIESIKRTSSPILGLICDEEKQELRDNCQETKFGNSDSEDKPMRDEILLNNTLPCLQQSASNVHSWRQGLENIMKHHTNNMLDRHKEIEASRDLQNMAFELAGDDIPLSNIKALRHDKLSKRQWQKQAREEALKLYRNVTMPKLDPISKGRTSLCAFESASKTSSTSYLGSELPANTNGFNSDAEVAVLLTSVMRKIYPNATTIGILADSLGLGKDQVSRVVIHHLHKDGIFQKLVKGRKQPPLWRINGDFAAKYVN